MNFRNDPGMLTAGKYAIGQPVLRTEDPKLVRGEGRFTDDVSLPGQAFLVMVRSRYAHGIIRAIKTDAARKMPGVLGIFTGTDLVQAGYGTLKCIVPFKNRDGSEMKKPARHPMPVDKVRFVGDPIACVIANTLLQAKDAAEAIEVDIDPLPAVTNPEEAVRDGAPALYDDVPHNISLDYHYGSSDQVAAAFATAAHVTSLKLVNSRVVVNAMEPRAAVGLFENGRFTLHVGSQGVFGMRANLAQVLNVEPKMVHVLTGNVGGSFGMKAAVYAEYVCVLHAARALGRPVKWTDERSTSFVSDSHGRDHELTAELALDADGTFLAFRGANTSNVGAHAVSFHPLNKGMALTATVYRVPAVSMRGRAVVTNTAPTTPYRSAGRPEVMFVMERLIDLAARRHGFDRLELRRKNLVAASAMPYRNAVGTLYDSGDYMAALDRAVALADWAGFEARRAEARGYGRYRGIGVANYIELNTGFPRERAHITVRPERSVDVVLGTLSSGQGHATSFAQLIVEWLGVELSEVRLVTGDTDVTVVGGGAHSARALRLAAVVMAKASDQIVEKGKRIAAWMLEAADADIEFSARRFSVKGTDRSVDLFEAAAAALRPDAPQDRRGPLDGTSDETMPVPSFPYGSAVCEVEVDPETGVVELVRYTTVDDCGRAVNPMILHGQTHGGIAQGVGQALWEACAYDETGQLLSSTLMEYALPRADMLPAFTTEISEVPSTSHPLGLRGGGEGGTTPALGAVVNAIVDALAELGVEHVEMPATSERVWQAIRNAQRTP